MKNVRFFMFAGAMALIATLVPSCSESEEATPDYATTVAGTFAGEEGLIVTNADTLTVTRVDNGTVTISGLDTLADFTASLEQSTNEEVVLLFVNAKTVNGYTIISEFQSETASLNKYNKTDKELDLYISTVKGTDTTSLWFTGVKL